MPSIHQVAFRHAAEAAVIMIVIVLIGVFSRELYIKVAHPPASLVKPADGSTLGTALAFGVAAAAVELILVYSGMRERGCREIVGNVSGEKYT